MAGFSADWLALREPADRRARATVLGRHVFAQIAGDGPTRIVDLGAGTGANCRWLMAYGTGEQHWRLVDHDAALLAAVPARMTAWTAEPGAPGRSVEVGDASLVLRDPAHVCRLDLIQGALVPFDAAVVADGQLVTAAALLDLVSEKWLRSVAEACESAGAAVLFSLTYDGRLDCLPSEADDPFIRRLVNRHQRNDKGFGPALGPDAAATAARVFGESGYHLERRRSDWVLTHEADLQRELLAGWARAATEMAPEEANRIDVWLRTRLAHVDALRSVIRVGHEDLAAWIDRR